MSWRGSIDVKDRVFSVCVYSIPIFYAMTFGVFMLGYFPDIFIQILKVIIAPVDLVNRLLGTLGLGNFTNIIIFFALYFGIVRNERISHFLRFNAMQAILIDIFLVLCSIVIRVFGFGGFGESLILQTLFNVIFLSTLVACLYSMIQSALGKYAEIPTISEAAASQVR